MLAKHAIATPQSQAVPKAKQLLEFGLQCWDVALLHPAVV
jgi:hypothetical protein